MKAFAFRTKLGDRSGTEFSPSPQALPEPTKQLEVPLNGARNGWRWLPIAVVASIFTACQQDTPVGVDERGGLELSEQEAPVNQASVDQLVSIMEAVNAGLLSNGADYRVVKAEYTTAPFGGEAGNTVLAKNTGNKRLNSDFVAFDTDREGWSGPTTGPQDDITYAVDMTGDAVPPLGVLGAGQTDAAIDRAMASWEAVNCSNLPIVQNPDFGLDIGVVAFLNGLGGSPFVFADVQHAGFRDINFAGNILGVTFTFIFIDDAGNPLDEDGDGLPDTAFTEIYYDPSWSWADDGVTDIDLESVAVHEAGHGLSQAHFGKVFLKNDGSLKRSPLAVMNAIYSMPLRDLQGTDNGGHCSNWANWPNS
jgi:hypothetical protein